MITPDYVRTMAAYNNWQNGHVFAAASKLDDDARRENRGAFFGSIHATLNHLYWGDRLWMSRFSGTAAPRMTSVEDSVSECRQWADLTFQRLELDREIEVWARDVSHEALNRDLTWFSAVLDAEVSRPLPALVVHFFNHQTHHRGQVHAMLTAAGRNPGDTDLFLMPEAD